MQKQILDNKVKNPQPYRDGEDVGFVSAVNNNSTKFIAIQPRVIIWGDNVRRLLFRCLEVIDRLDAAYDFGGGSDVFNDFVYAFISHGRLIKCIRNDAGGKDACHILLVFFHSQTLKRGGTGHQTARAVRCGAVPVFVALADANEGAVAHIDVNEQLLADLLA